MLFPRTIQLDQSDGFAYEVAAAPGEWAVPGAFAFAGDDIESLAGKRQLAFRGGFLGTTSFGWSSFVQVATIREAEYEEVVQSLARHFVDRYGAPSLDAALSAAREEAAFAAGLCEYPVGTLLAVERHLEERGIVERFRVVKEQGQGVDAPARLWELVADDAPEGGEV